MSKDKRIRKALEKLSMAQTDDKRQEILESLSTEERKEVDKTMDLLGKIPFCLKNIEHND